MIATPDKPPLQSQARHEDARRPRPRKCTWTIPNKKALGKKLLLATVTVSYQGATKTFRFQQQVL